MERTPFVALGLCLTMLLAGCLNVTENVEVPDVVLPDDWSTITARTMASPQLFAYDDCEELEQSLKQSIEEQYRVELMQAVAEQYYYGDMMWAEDAEMAMDDGAVAETSSSAQPRTTAPTRVEGEDFSGTNNQESGVDEADFVKTDGYHIYYLQGQHLHIFGVPEFGELEATYNTTLSGNPVAMMLDGDQLVVISTMNPWSISRNHPVVDAMGWGDDYGSSWRTSSLTKFTVFDITNRSAPDVERELFIEGSYITAREINGTVRTITHAWMDVPGVQSWLDLPTGYWNLDYDDPLRQEIREKVAYQTMLSNSETLDRLTLADLIPQVYEYSNGEVSIHAMSDNACRDFVAPEDGMERGISSIFSLDLTSADFDYEVDHVVGTYPQVYASSDLLVLAESAFSGWWFWGNDDMDEMTNLHTFDISAPDATLYTGSGRIAGTVLNQFSISEHEGVLRVATTVGQWARWWMEDPDPMSSQLVTLVRSVDLDTEKQVLVEAGRVDGIAPGERIWSARFDGDRAYLVTFEQIDPLWVIDVSDETNPTILGELKVPGVSTYIHPLSRDHLLTIGLAPANEDGTGLDWSGTQISLFDIADPTNPQQADALRLSPVAQDQANRWSWSSSEATYESKAFQYWAPKSMLAVPLSTYRYAESYENGKYTWSYEYISKLMLVEVNESDGNLSVYGEVNHSSLYEADEERFWWSEKNIRRSIFMGDFVYAISSAGITATNLTTMEESDRLSIPHSSVYDRYYGDDVVESEGASGESGEDRPDESTSDGAASEPRDA
ncbi:MAG: beta-propeller domain-containing protein [Candidatus Poseidonia sp.]|nr:beta-propeller domain-containing protein [Poseidonia sp.]